MNLTKACKQVLSNKGSGGVGGLSTEVLQPRLRDHKETLLPLIKSGKYRPNPVRRVEKPKAGGKRRPFGIPAVADRLMQQSISQLLTPLYGKEFRDAGYGFRPVEVAMKRRVKPNLTLHQAISMLFGLDLEKFFDTLNHSRPIELPPRRIRDGRVIPLIRKYLLAGVQAGGKLEASSYAMQTACRYYARVSVRRSGQDRVSSVS